MKKYTTLLCLLLALVMVMACFTGCAKQPAQSDPADTTEPAQTTDTTPEDSTPAEPTDTRETVNIRFAQFGNNLDDLDGYANDPIKAAIEQAVGVTLEYDTGTDGFDDRMQTELFTGSAPDLFPTWGESDKIASWVQDGLVTNLGEIVNADPDRYPTLYKMMNSEEWKAYNKLYTGDETASYAIYSVAAFADPSFGGVPVYNQAILDEVNEGKVPATVDEFLTYCEAAGSAGYVGWWPRNDKLTNWNEIDATLALPQGTSITVPKGAGTGTILSGEAGTDSEYWTVSAVSEQSKAVVKQLAELYKNGGLDANIGVKGDFDDAYADFGNGTLGAVNFGFGYPGQFRDFFKSAWLAVHPDASIDDLAVGQALTSNGSYGKTYSSAAKAIKNAKSWKKLGNINWGFTDGSAKAQQGFVNGLAAILRPLDGVLSLLLAGDDLAVGQILTDLVKNLNFGSSKDTVQLKNGKLRIRIKGSDKYSKTSVLEINLYKVIEDVKSLSIYGGNGYESAIVPLLEALECPNVKTYKQYKADIKKSTDSILTDVLNPIVGFLNKVLDAPFDTLTAVLPNVAYYIDNNGLAQLVNNLLSPVTSLLPVLKKNGVDVEVIVKALAGKSLNDLVKDALGVNIHLNLNHLNKCDIQNAIVPLVNKLLKSKKINIQLPKIDWGTLASHGTVSTVKSAAKNSEGYYNRKHVTANQGETLIAVLRYVANLLTKNISGLKSILGGIDAIKDYKSIINAVLDQIGTSSADQIIRALFYLLQENPTNAFWNYSEYQTKDYKFSYPSTVDQEFLKNIPPMLDGLIGSLADLNKLIADAAFKDSTINGMITGIGKALDGVKINDSTNLTALLAQTGIDYSTKTVAKLLTDESYGKTFANAAAVIGSASSWSKVNTSALKWGVKDKDSFFNALAAVMRPFYGVLDVLLNDASLGIFNIVHIPGSNGYSSVVVPLLEAFGCYNIKTQYQYREDISKAYDNILLDIVNSLWDKVEDILNAPLQTLMSMLPNLALFIANDGLLQLIENLFTPVSALLDALKPIVNVNTVLTQVFKAFKVDLNGLLAKVGLKLDLNIDLYDLTAMLKPIIGVDNIVPLLNQVLGMIKIKGKPLGLELMDIDWFQLASHGKVMTDASQAATYGTRVFVKGDASETLIAVLRYLVEVVNYKDNYNTVASLVGSLIGGSDNSSITDVVGTVLNMLKGDTDKVIGELCNLLQQLGG